MLSLFCKGKFVDLNGIGVSNLQHGDQEWLVALNYYKNSAYLWLKAVEQPTI